MHAKVLPVFKSISPFEEDVTESKFKTVGLIFQLVSKNAVVFDTALWESNAFTKLFSRSQTTLFALWYKRREYVPIITMEKQQELAFGGYPQQVMPRTLPRATFVDLLAFWGVF